MNVSFFQHQSTDPGMNVILTSILGGMTAFDPVGGVKAGGVGYFGITDNFIYYPATTTASAYMVITINGGTIILIGGAESAAVVNQLIPGTWGGVDIQSSSGAHNVFYVAAETILASIPALFAIAGKPLFVIGHSFGGATAQVLAYLCQSQLLSGQVRCWSYGAPRPGTDRFAARMSGIDSTRWMTLGDVVPHLPPNTTDNLSIAAILSTGQLRLSNSLVQPPYGYTCDPVTRIQAASNNGALVSFLGFTVFGKVFAVQFGGTSIPHLLSSYRSALLACVTGYVPPNPRPRPNPELPVTPTPRQLQQVIAAAEDVVRADATAPGGITRSYVVPPVQTPDSPRYRAGKDGRLWVIRLEEEIVGIGTGKRQAKRIARQWNLAARATLQGA